MLSAAGRVHFLYFVAVIFFGSFYLVNLILAIVSMSYQEQQQKVRAEIEEHERRKVEDELERQSQEVRKISEFHEFMHLESEKYGDNRLIFDNSNRKVSSTNLSVEYDQNNTVESFVSELFASDRYIFRKMNRNVNIHFKHRHWYFLVMRPVSSIPIIE